MFSFNIYILIKNRHIETRLKHDNNVAFIYTSQNKAKKLHKLILHLNTIQSFVSKK